MNDLYEVLGVPRSATPELLSAAYRALVKAFHPDAFNTDRAFAEARLKSINAAYEVLRDPDRRRRYDESISGEPVSSSPTEMEDWTRVCEFFPDLTTMGKDVDSISPELGLTFRLSVIQGKMFSEARSFKDQLVKRFAEDRFGTDSRLQIAGISALKLGRKVFALAINKACNLVGDQNADVILQRLAVDYPKDAQIVYEECGLQDMLPTGRLVLPPGVYRISDKLRFRILPGAEVIVFEEFKNELDIHRRFSSVNAMLSAYGELGSAILYADDD